MYAGPSKNQEAWCCKKLFAGETVKLDISSQAVEIAKEINDTNIFTDYDNRQEIYIEEGETLILETNKTYFLD